MFVDKRSFFIFFLACFPLNTGFYLYKTLLSKNWCIMDNISREDYDQIEELFHQLLGEGKSAVCPYGDTPFPFVLVEKKKIPANHPLGKYIEGRPVFGIYMEREYSKDPPAIFANKDRVPEEFRGISRRFHDMKAFFAYRHAAREDYRQAALDTLKEIEKDAKKTKEQEYLQNHYCGSA